MLSKSTTYANVVSPLPTNGHCPTCELLAKKLLQKFPEMTDELKALIPNVQVTKPSTQTQVASETNKPLLHPQNPQTLKALLYKKLQTHLPLYKISLLKKVQKHLPLQNDLLLHNNLQRNLNLHLHNLQLDLMFHLKKINLMIHPGQKKRSTSKPKPQSRDTPESCEITVKEDDPVPTSNRFSELDEMDADVENLEGEASDSEASIWSISKDPWNKDTDNWNLSIAETSVMKS